MNTIQIICVVLIAALAINQAVFQNKPWWAAITITLSMFGWWVGMQLVTN